MDARLRFFNNHVIAGSSALFIRLRNTSDPRLRRKALSYVVRNAYLIISICSGRCLTNTGRDASASNRNDLKRLIRIIIGRAKINGSNVNDRYLLTNT